MGTGDVMAEDHPSLLPHHHHHPFLPLVMWFSYTAVSMEDGAQMNRNKNVSELFFLSLPLAQEAQRPRLLERALGGENGFEELKAPAPKAQCCEAITSWSLLMLPTHRPQPSPTHTTERASAGFPTAQGEKQMEKGKPGKLHCLGAQGRRIFFFFLGGRHLDFCSSQ